MFIINKSWGFNTLSDKIAYSQIIKGTKLTKQGIIKIIQNLEQRKIIVIDRIKKENNFDTNTYLFNKHYDTWLNKKNEVLFTSSDIKYFKQNIKKVVNKNDLGSKQQEEKVVNHSLHTKETITKENTKENIISSEIFNYWNKQEIIIHKKLDNNTENKIKKTLTLISVKQLIKTIHNYSQILKSNAHFFSYIWTLLQFLERGLSKQGIKDKKGFWQFIPEAKPFVRFANRYNTTLTIENWKPLTKDNLLNRDGLYFGFPFGLVKQNIYDVKEHVDDAYFRYPELNASSHFEWLEELLVTLKYQRNNLSKDIDIQKYLSLWDKEKEKPKIKAFIKEVNDE